LKRERGGTQKKGGLRGKKKAPLSSPEGRERGEILEPSQRQKGKKKK